MSCGFLRTVEIHFQRRVSRSTPSYVFQFEEYKIQDWRLLSGICPTLSNSWIYYNNNINNVLFILAYIVLYRPAFWLAEILVSHSLPRPHKHKHKHIHTHAITQSRPQSRPQSRSYGWCGSTFKTVISIIIIISSIGIGIGIGISISVPDSTDSATDTTSQRSTY